MSGNATNQALTAQRWNGLKAEDLRKEYHSGKIDHRILDMN